MHPKLTCLIILVCSFEVSFSQKIFEEKFENEYKNSWKNLENFPKLYSINPYTPRQRDPINISSEINDSVYDDYYVAPCCIDSNDLHSFFATITVFDEKIPAERELMVIKLDSVLKRGQNYSIRFSGKYHPHTKYKIDSIQILFLNQENDIKAWLAEKKFSGQFVKFSLGDINNRLWGDLKSKFFAENDYSYLILGNLKTDGETKVSRISDCQCTKRSKGYWNYSELYVDGIIINKE